MNYFKTVHEVLDEKDLEIMSAHWCASYHYRRAALHRRTHKNVLYILNNWPIVKTHFGYHLVYFCLIIMFSFLESSKLQLSIDFRKDHGPLCDKSLISNWGDIRLITDKLKALISKKKVRSSIAQLPSHGRNLTKRKIVQLRLDN